MAAVLRHHVTMGGKVAKLILDFGLTNLNKIIFFFDLFYFCFYYYYYYYYYTSFVPLVLSLTGTWFGTRTGECLKGYSLKTFRKMGPTVYSQTIGWLRAKLSFALLRSSIRCIRGARSSPAQHIKTSNHWT